MLVYARDNMMSNLYFPDFSGKLGCRTHRRSRVSVSTLDSYSVGVNIGAAAEMSQSLPAEDFSTTPEPRTYALLVGLGLENLGFSISQSPNAA